ncbi:MAG: dephospho-CoA kinase [Bacteroidia bacterium]
MRIVGITGGIGCGKTYVLHQIAAKGYPVYVADQAARRLMETSADIRQKVVAIFGEKAYTQEGSLNRSFIAEQIFHNPLLRQALNAIVHPATFEDFARWVAVRAGEGHSVVFKEAAITVETQAWRQVDVLVVVYAPLYVRLRRLQTRDGLSEAECWQRLTAQWPEWRKIPYADFLILNDGRLPLEPQIAELLNYVEAI